jgi:gas vesicle protein
MMNEKFTKGNGLILTSVLVGGAIGAGLGLLLAPKAGKALTKDLKRFAANTKDRVSDALEKGEDLYEESRSAVAKAVGSGRKVYAEGREKFEELTGRKERSILVPILASSIIGAGIALLLAPKTGKEARSDLKEFAGKTMDQAAVAVDKGKVIYDEGVNAIMDTVEKGKNAFIAGKEKLRQVA